MKRARLLVIILALPLVTILLVWLYARTSLPQLRGELAVPGIDQALQIVRDEAGIVHIHAESDADAFYGLGFAHAQDRAWQMEMNRRIAAGRLSELFGEATLDTDRFLRTLGLQRAAEASLDHILPETRSILEAYAAGVNAFLESGHRLPPEFAILGVEPEPWRPEHSLGWTKMMSWDLSDDWDQEILRFRLADRLGPQRAAELLPGVPADSPVILEGAGEDGSRSLRETLDGLLALDDGLRDRFGLRGLDVGSNGWVVAGRLSASGGALLANDPHLDAQIPGIWYLAEIHGDRLQASGATLPGVPGIVLGRNRDIAWGATNLNPDVQDLFLERIDPDDPNRYQAGRGWQAMEIVRETIRVKDAQPIEWAARATRNGPMISDALPDAPAPLALRWTALDPDDTTVDAFLAIARARDWPSFEAAFERYVTPSQNFVYADAEGHIGYIGPGRIPIRRAGDGRLPAPGWQADAGWQGFIPIDQLPRAFDPPAGYIVTANHRPVGPDYPYYLGSEWAPPYRARRIADFLEAAIAGGRGLTLEALHEIQGDQVSLQARELLPALLAVEAEDPRQAEALALLEGWDGRMEAEAAAPALYQAWLLHLPEALLADELGGELLERMLRRRHPTFLAAELGRPEGSTWCDRVLTPELERCPEILLDALDAALDDLEARMGGDAARWRWGRLHRTRYDHNPFSQVALLRPIFHRSIENGGDPFTVNVANIDLAAPYDQGNVPSYRQRIDMGRPEESRFIATTGQSGHPLSRHYDDWIEPHREVRDLPMRLSETPPTGDVLRLLPAAPSR